METTSLTEAINSSHRIPPGPPASVIWRAPGGGKTISSLLRNNMATASLTDAINPCCGIPPGNNMATASLTDAINPCCGIPPGPTASVNWRSPGGRKTISSLLNNINNHFAVYEWYDGAGINAHYPTMRELLDHLFDPLIRADGFVVSIVGYPGAKEVLEDTHIIDGKAVSLKSIVFVGGLSTTVTDVEFVNFFSKFGKIVATEIVLHPATKQQQKFGFVVFKSEQDAKDLVKKKEINFLGSEVMVKAARIHIKPIPPIEPSYEGFFSFSDRVGYNTQSGRNTQYGRSFDPSQRALGSFGGNVGPSYCAPGSFSERNGSGFS